MFGNIRREESLSSLVKFLSRGKSPDYVEISTIKVLNQACIYWDKIKYENARFQNIQKLNPNAILHNNDLLINSTGTGTLGRCNIFLPSDTATYMADSHITIVRLKKDLINSVYLKAFLSFAHSQTELYRKCVNGSTNQIELSKEKLCNFKVQVPEIDKQLEYASFIQQLDKSKFRIKKSLEKLEMTYKVLLQEYFG